MTKLKFITCLVVVIFTFSIAGWADDYNTSKIDIKNNLEKLDSVSTSKDSVYSAKTNISVTKNDKYRSFVKTKNKCSKCGCSGYWGYKHGNGTYEGKCSNSDGHGHTCGHGPEKHGLRKW